MRLLLSWLLNRLCRQLRLILLLLRGVVLLLRRLLVLAVWLPRSMHTIDRHDAGPALTPGVSRLVQCHDSALFAGAEG